MSNNKTLSAAKNEKNDEHYTQLSDIENEVRQYRDQFAGKTVLCNCDDPRCSNFYFPAYDNNGNVTKYIDGSGDVVAAYEYDAFGRLIS